MKSLIVVFIFLGLVIGLSSCKDDSPKIVKYEFGNCFVQKGPFVQGSNISISELNDSFEPNGNTFNTETKDDMGSFSISVLLSSKFVEVNANGYYFNEVTGKIAGPISLKILTDLSIVNGININILTFIEKDRIKMLMLKENKEFLEAKKQAEEEILRAFNIPNEIASELVSFEKMDISTYDQSAAVLLAISITVQGQLSPGELSELLAKISKDIADNGVIDNQDLIVKLNINSRSLNPEYIKEYIAKRYSDLHLGITIAPFEKYLDINGNGNIDMYDLKLISPIGNLFSIKPEFKWEKSEKPMIKYQFQISSDSTFNSIIEEMESLTSTNYQLATKLEYDKTYYWRVATIDDKTGSKIWTPAIQVIPKDGIININTSEITAIGTTYAYCKGTIINDGGATITERGFVFNTNTNPIISDSMVVVGNGIGSFNYRITGLTSDVNYYVRSYGINSQDTTYGNEVSLKTLSVLPSTVSIPAGTFIMGSPDYEADRLDNETQHEVTLSAFRMSNYEITNAQFADFLNTKNMNADGIFTAGSFPTQKLISVSYDWGLQYTDGQWLPIMGYENYPVTGVTWFGAVEFAKYMGGRLPTEAEWEYGCRAGSTTPFNTGSCLSNTEANYNWEYPYGSCTNTNIISPRKIEAVGSYPPNAWGLYDMHGNVYEWCSDWSGNYPTDSQTNPSGPTTGVFRVCRGSYFYGQAQYLRSAKRDQESPWLGEYHLGFRIVIP